MNAIKRIALLLLFGAAAVFAAAPNSNTAQDLLDQIDRDGGQSVLNRFVSDIEAYNAFLSRIETGDPAWLEVAGRLREYSDAALSEEIDSSVAIALPVAPEQVLMLIGGGFSLQNVCASPFIEPEPGVAEAYEQKVLKALSSVTNPELKELAFQCAKCIRPTQ